MDDELVKSNGDATSACLYLLVVECTGMRSLVRFFIFILLFSVLLSASALEIKDDTEDASALLIPQDAFRNQHLVLACLLDGSIVALDADSGETRWKIDGTANFFTPLDKLEVLIVIYVCLIFLYFNIYFRTFLCESLTRR